MKQAALTNCLINNESIHVKCSTYILIFIAGLIGPLGFAPFHMPGLSILSIASLFYLCSISSAKHSFYFGLTYGLGYFGLGVSWVIISIHDYGHLDYFTAGLTTSLFIIYLALFPAIVGYVFNTLKWQQKTLNCVLLFSTLWCLSEYLRSFLFTGFPWLLVGTSLIDTPAKYLAPLIGIYGLSFYAALAATLLAVSAQEHSSKRYLYSGILVLMIIVPAILKPVSWTQVIKSPITIGVVQANLSMRDKWDEALFWNLLKFYNRTIDKLLGKQLIILPESAIPLPASYLNDYLIKLHNKTTKAHSALLLGIMQPTNDTETSYYNSIASLGLATGGHIKQQLVPFGEYIPQPFVAINRWLGLPELDILPGNSGQPLIEVAGHPIASLICYEIAYPHILRTQLPLAEWIVSISDNGWFGRSLASYQQLQMAQMLSLLTGRYQVVVNNDGLSSVINNYGDIIKGLPPFSAGILQSELYPATGSTPWVIWSDYPIVILCSLFIFFILILRITLYRKQ